MGHYINEVVGIAFNAKVKAPVHVNSRLPNVSRFVVFLSVKGRVVEVLQKERGLFVEGALYQERCRLITLAKTLAVKKFHLRCSLGLPCGLFRAVKSFEHFFH
jgi:hypothetical protein